MLHTKFHENRPAGSGEEDFLKGFYHIWAWRPSWSCDKDHVNKFSFPCGDWEPIIVNISHESNSVGNSETAIWQWMCLIG